MANEAPERIWIWPDTIDEMGSSVNRNEINGYVEYVRADKLEELAAENKRLEKSLRTVQNAAKTLASALGSELEHRRRNADYDHKLRTEHESLIERDAVMTDALLKAEATLTAERAAHAETKREGCPVESPCARIIAMARAHTEANKRAKQAEAQRDEALKALEEAKRKIPKERWYWPEDDTSSDACRDNPREALEYQKPGEIDGYSVGGVAYTNYFGWLPPADDADSDDEFEVNEPTREAAKSKMDAEIARRALTGGKNG